MRLRMQEIHADLGEHGQRSLVNGFELVLRDDRDRREGQSAAAAAGGRGLLRGRALGPAAPAAALLGLGGIHLDPRDRIAPARRTLEQSGADGNYLAIAQGHEPVRAPALIPAKAVTTQTPRAVSRRTGSPPSRADRAEKKSLEVDCDNTVDAAKRHEYFPGTSNQAIVIRLGCLLSRNSTGFDLPSFGFAKPLDDAHSCAEPPRPAPL